jgi:hypothetical protein
MAIPFPNQIELSEGFGRTGRDLKPTRRATTEDVVWRRAGPIQKPSVRRAFQVAKQLDSVEAKGVGMARIGSEMGSVRYHTHDQLNRFRGNSFNRNDLGPAAVHKAIPKGAPYEVADLGVAWVESHKRSHERTDVCGRVVRSPVDLREVLERKEAARREQVIRGSEPLVGSRARIPKVRQDPAFQRAQVSENCVRIQAISISRSENGKTGDPPRGGIAYASLGKSVVPGGTPPVGVEVNRFVGPSVTEQPASSG